MAEPIRLRPHVLRPGAGPTVSFLGMRVAYKMTSQDTAGKWSLLEYLAPAKFAGLPAHWHNQTDEVFYVLEGIVTFRLDDELFMAKPDTLVHIPKGVLHTFSNQTEAPARFLQFATPGGQDEYIKELAAMAQFEPGPAALDWSERHTLHEKYDTCFPNASQA